MKLVRVETASTPIPTTVAFASMVVATLLCCGLWSSSADAQTRSNVQAERGRQTTRPVRAQPESGRYQSESGESFVFDRSGQRALFRFLSRTEVWALRGNPAPRGDIIYRNDAGAQILRVTPDGGVTLYSVRAPNGSPASRVGAAPALERPLLGPVQLSNLMIQRSFTMSRALGRMVSVLLDGEDDEALCIDALMVSTDAVLRMAASPTTRRQLDGLHTVTITEGRSASVVYANGDLRVTVQPGQGITGRPSSSSVIQAVLRN
jgi:hypothetical protein